MIMITMRRNLGSILIMTTTISSITMHMKKEQGKVLFDNQIINESIGSSVNLGQGWKKVQKCGEMRAHYYLVIDLKKG